LWKSAPNLAIPNIQNFASASMVKNFFQIYWTLIAGEEWLFLQAGVIIPTNNYRPWIETMWLTITIDNNIICFGCAYCSPSSPSHIISKNALLKIVSDILKIKSFETIIVGNFSLSEILWIDGYGSSKTQTTGSSFASCLSNNYLYQTVNEPIKICSGQNLSLLGLAIVSSPEILISNNYLPSPLPGKSIHVPHGFFSQFNSLYN